jgi:WD40 repeat protein
VRLGPLNFVHPDARRCAFAGGGSLLVSAGYDGTVRAWRVPSGEELWRCRFPEQEATLSFAADGALVAAGGEEDKVVVRDVRTGRVVHTFEGGGGLCLSPDGGLLAVSWPALAVRDTRSWKVVARIESSILGRCSLAFQGREKALAVAGDGVNQIELWDLVTRKKRATISVPGVKGIDALAFSSNGKVLATASSHSVSRSVVVLWDMTTRKEIRRMRTHHPLSVALSPDGTTLATAGDRFQLWDVRSGKPIPLIPAFDHPCDCVFSPDGTMVAANAIEGCVRLWRRRGDSYHLVGAPRGPVVGLDTSPDGRFVAVAGPEVHLWGLRGKPAALRCFPRRVKETHPFLGGNGSRVALSPDGALLATDTEEGVIVHDVAAGKPVRQFGKLAGSIAALSFCDRGRQLADIEEGHNRRLETWEYLLHRHKLEGPGEAKSVLLADSSICQPEVGFAFSADGDLLIVADNEEYCAVWDVGAGRQRRKLALPRGEKYHRTTRAVLSLSPDGKTLALLRALEAPPKKGQKGTRADIITVLELWEVTTGQRQAVVRGNWDDTRCVQLSPCGRLIACGDWHGNVELRDLLTGKTLGRGRAHEGRVLRLRFTAAGDRLVSGGDDTTAVVWDTEELLGASARHKAGGRPRREQMERWWQALGEDAPAAGRAMWALAEAPRDAALLCASRLRPVWEAPAEDIRRSIAELGSDHFRAREVATEHLRGLGERAAPFMREALRSRPSLEAALRLEQLLAVVEKGPRAPQQLRALRAVTLLERIGTAEARMFLDRLAGGARDDELTREALQASRRLQRRLAR